MEASFSEKKGVGIEDSDNVMAQPEDSRSPEELKLKTVLEDDDTSDLAQRTRNVPQDSRSPSKKRTLEVGGLIDVLYQMDEHSRSTEEKSLVMDGSKGLTLHMGDMTEDSRSPSKKKVLGDDRARDLVQQTEDLAGSPSKKQKSDSQITEERHFYNIFQEVLDVVARKYGLSEEKISDGISAIIAPFRNKQFSMLNLSTPDNICGYLFRIGTLDAGLVRFRTLQAIQNCPVLESALELSKLQVVSLGGGPGNDILGFLSALHEVRRPKECHMKLSVVDAADWKDCVCLVKYLVQDWDFGSVSELFKQNNVDMRFHRTTLPCSRSDSCYDAVRKADIILISKLMSILDETSQIAVIENVYQLMKDSSLVLFVDSPFYPDLWTDFEVLYISPESDCYNLLESRKRFGYWISGSSKARIAILRKKAEDTLSESPINV